ncbi:MAG: hypothetical protein EBY22_16645, partial [Gammaproteobacteria bacterium]|nr:hypothetical protein [Gammaproteobacteria bacterium]
RGIEPDIEVDLLPMPKTKTDEHQWAVLKERDLQGHLNNTTADKSKETNKEKDGHNAKIEPITDYQILEAHHLLRGIQVLNTYSLPEKK